MSSLPKSLNSMAARSVSSPPKTRCRSCCCGVDMAFLWRPGASLRELRHAVADQRQKRIVGGGAGGKNGAMHNIHTIECERMAGEIGHEAAGFVHQKVRGGKVPVVAAAGRERDVEHA